MKVLFISDYNLSHTPGGAQVSNDLIIKKGVETGFDITFHNFDSSPLNLIKRYDLVISSNLEHLCHLSRREFDFIVNHPNHMRLEHDSCLYLSKEDRETLFKSSKLNFFLSHFHKKFFEEFYGDIFGKTAIVYDPIDTSIFYDRHDGAPRDLDIVYCGFVHPLKGAGNLVNFAANNPERMIEVFGWPLAEMQNLFGGAKNINLHGGVSHSEVADIFRRSKFVYHDPLVNEPFCRMVGEALLCGCSVIGNPDKIGSCLEFQEVGETHFKSRVNHAPTLFWEKVLGALEAPDPIS